MTGLFIGVDPGKSGAIAFLPTIGEPWVVGTDSTHRDLNDAMTDAIADHGPIRFAMIEFVASSPQMGVKSAFSFGQNYGSLEMLLASFNIPFERVTPRKWQSAMGCLTKGNKNISKRKSQELFPSVKITHRNADALLIAEFCKRTYCERSGRRNAEPTDRP